MVHLAVRSSSSRFGPEILDTLGRRLRLTDNFTTLVCVPNGNPRPSLQWVLRYEIDSEVQTHVISTQSEISLNSQNVTGNYSCRATNGAQHAVKVGKLPEFNFHCSLVRYNKLFASVSECLCLQRTFVSGSSSDFLVSCRQNRTLRVQVFNHAHILVQRWRTAPHKQREDQEKEQ